MQCRRHRFDRWVEKIPWRRKRQPTSVSLPGEFHGQKSLNKTLQLKNSSRSPWFDSWIGKSHWRGSRLPTPVFFGFPCGSAGKESACNAGDLGSLPGLRRSPGEGKGYPLQYSGLENFMDCIVHGVAKSQIRLSDLHSLNINMIHKKFISAENKGRKQKDTSEY